MSDWDAKVTVKFPCEIENLRGKRKKNKSGIDEFSQAIARIAVAQVCETLGFQSVQESALNALADVGVRYIREVGRTARFYAYLGNRCQCNLLDLIQGLEDLGSVQGFSSASEVNHALSESGVIKDIERFVSEEEEIPFSYLIPPFPIEKQRILDPSVARLEEHSPDVHIPCWLPRFPDPETYMKSNQHCENSVEALVENKIPPVEDTSRKVGRSLMTLQQKFVSSWDETEVALELGNAAKCRQQAENNPFLVPPFQFGEKEVSFPLLPAKLVDEATRLHQRGEILENGVSTPDTSLPPDNGASGGSCGPEDTTKMLLLERKTVHFKFENGKNSVSMEKNISKKNADKISLWFSNDCERKVEKKSKAEQILWGNIEIPQELSSL